MHGAQLEEAVRTVLAQHLDIPPTHITEEFSLLDLGLEDDDRAHQLLGAVGEQLDCRFPDDFFDGLDTYGQLTSAVRIAVGA